MDRRRFLKRVTATAVAVDRLSTAARAFQPAGDADLAGHTLLCEFKPPNSGARAPWNTFVGTGECSETMPVLPAGNTRTDHPNQYFPELSGLPAQRRFEGLLGGWMPAVLKIFPICGTAYIDFHDHTPGSWTAGGVAGINGGRALFCIPAQQTIPMLVRWMLALEDSDEDRLYIGKGLPREGVGSGKEIRIERAPTRWAGVNFRVAAQPASHSVAATVEVARAGAPRELHVKLRTLLENAVRSATVSGRPAPLGGRHGDTVVFPTGGEGHFEIVGQS